MHACDYRYHFFLKKGKGGFLRRFRVRAASQPLYLRLRRSTYSDAASAENATTAIPLNSGTGMFDCSR